MELKKVVLPSGAIAYIKPELTAGDYDDVQAIFLDAVETEITDEKDEKGNPIWKSVKKMSNSQIFLKAKYKLIEILVVKLELPGDPAQIIQPVTEEYARGMSMLDVNFLKSETEAIKDAANISAEERKN